MMLRASHRLFALPCALALTLGASASARASMPPVAALALAPASKAAVEVEVHLDQPDDEAVAARLRGEIVKALNAEGIAVTKNPGPQVGAIRIEVRWNADDNHEITAVVESGGEKAAPEGGPWVCDTCREAQLTTQVAELVPALVPLLPEAPEAAEVASTPGPAPQPDEGPTEREGPRDRRKLGTLGKVGIPLLVVGVGGAITGGVLVGLGDRREMDAERQTGTNYTVPGIAILVTGGVLAITGAVLLGVDLSKSRKKKAAAAPMLGPGFAGLGVSGRF